MANTISSGVTLDSDYLKVSDEVKNQSELDKDVFLNLLVTQMKYQDPLEPMDNSQMLAQLAQFTALEQMTNVAQASEKQLASGMIGKYVQYLHKDATTGTSEYLVGKVDYVKLSGNSPVMRIGDVDVELSDIYQVYDSSDVQTNQTPYELIGKTVQGMVKQETADGTEKTVMVEGEVQGIEMKNGLAYMVIGTDKNKMTVSYSELKNMVETPSITGRYVTATYKDSDGKDQTIEGIAEYILIGENNSYSVYVKGKEKAQLVDYYSIKHIKNSNE